MVDEQDKRGNGWAWSFGCVVVAITAYACAYFAMVEKTTSGLPRYSKSKSVNAALTTFFKPMNMFDRKSRRDFWVPDFDDIIIE